MLFSSVCDTHEFCPCIVSRKCNVFGQVLLYSECLLWFKFSGVWGFTNTWKIGRLTLTWLSPQQGVIQIICPNLQIGNAMHETCLFMFFSVCLARSTSCTLFYLTMSKPILFFSFYWQRSCAHILLNGFCLILQKIQVGAAKVLSVLFVLSDCTQPYVFGNAWFGLDEKQVCHVVTFFI